MTAANVELRPVDVQASMARIRDAHDYNRRLNAAGLTYNVWMSGVGARCLRCGSAFPGHHCHVVGSPAEAHRIAQPVPEQESLW